MEGEGRGRGIEGKRERRVREGREREGKERGSDLPCPYLRWVEEGQGGR